MRQTKGVQYQYDGVPSHLGVMRKTSSNFEIVRLYGNRRARLFPKKVCVTMIIDFALFVGYLDRTTTRDRRHQPCEVENSSWLMGVMMRVTTAQITCEFSVRTLIILRVLDFGYPYDCPITDDIR